MRFTDQRHDRIFLGVLLSVLVIALGCAAQKPADHEIGQAPESSTLTTVAQTSTTETGDPSSTTTATEVAAVVPATAVEPVPHQAPAVAGDLDCGEWGDLIAAYFPAEQVGKACAVMLCESGGNPGAVSHTADFGLFQLNAPSWRTRFAEVTGVSWDAGVHDPVLNVEFAAWLWSQSGWSPWVCAR